jgi:pimeloyl-ACP methyl ester carboxylesterase
MCFREVYVTDIHHRIVDSNGIRIHIAEQGEGPLVLLCHGFPEGWYSWRHQLKALAEAGFHAVAPDMRGYGETDRPEAIESYTMLHHVGDMVGLLDALGEKQAAIVGHDWGAPVAWNAAMMRPDLFRAVAGFSVPVQRRPSVRPTSLMRRTDESIWYTLYFQSLGIAESELERDVRASLYTMLGSGFGEDQPSDRLAMVDPAHGLLHGMSKPVKLPSWLSEQDLNHFTKQFTNTGFTGGLNWYRNIDRNWELLAPFATAKITVPALYIYGDRDIVARFPGMDQSIADLSSRVLDLRGKLCLMDCGHWTQQERPAEVSTALIKFLNDL